MGVSATTVSYVLNGTGAVGAEMSKRIRATAKQLGYRANQAAKAVRTGKTRTVGLILPDLTNPFFPLLAQPIQMAAYEAGYAVLLIDSHGNTDWERSGAEDLLARGVDGIIWCPATEVDSLATLKGEVPIVAIDRPLPDYDSVSADSYGGARQLAEHLLALGHHSVGMVTGPMSLSSARMRRDGFVDRFSKAGTIAWEMENSFSINLCADVREAVCKNRASAIICANDLIALGVMRFLYGQGARVPDEVSVVGFDDISWASLATPGLATVRQPFAPLGKQAIELLLRRVEGDNAPRISLSLDMHLSQRGSLRNLSN
ncbi:LacI family transcriptional regulator [Novosphingobium endophyticum]|uniref:LacI family transcriptional regulator n=1 Tax=Novosphingobium endophyticum TaxID=1955250 RepID=A0A916X6W5_9SPHN|nr:LacI family transcriptional regulator [Novosphingobium endophyticum]